ncbi:hypothetical protein J7T55_001367 [Diaporthe amygdali]|uniref:uncharacterized protein n=1 Tax=Phomopsis amygdali TaxID=1214568 RepID=UPI0022FDE4AA|nr:uncharacterized protein J7T55_001367 [Diaporthe amygdali]KAJ0103748.1 hypothetical protein J7T55_001367 [Diaporthe amygdali]
MCLLTFHSSTSLSKTVKKCQISNQSYGYISTQAISIAWPKQSIGKEDEAEWWPSSLPLSPNSMSYGITDTPIQVNATSLAATELSPRITQHLLETMQSASCGWIHAILHQLLADWLLGGTNDNQSLVQLSAACCDALQTRRMEEPHDPSGHFCASFKALHNITHLDIGHVDFSSVGV